MGERKIESARVSEEVGDPEKVGVSEGEGKKDPASVGKRRTR